MVATKRRMAEMTWKRMMKARMTNMTAGGGVSGSRLRAKRKVNLSAFHRRHTVCVCVCVGVCVCRPRKGVDKKRNVECLCLSSLGWRNTLHNREKSQFLLWETTEIVLSLNYMEFEMSTVLLCKQLSFFFTNCS